MNIFIEGLHTCDNCGFSYVPSESDDRVIHLERCNEAEKAREAFGYGLLLKRGEIETHKADARKLMNDKSLSVSARTQGLFDLVWGYFGRSVSSYSPSYKHPPFNTYMAAYLSHDQSHHVDADVLAEAAKEIKPKSYPNMMQGKTYWEKI